MVFFFDSVSRASAICYMTPAVLGGSPIRRERLSAQPSRVILFLVIFPDAPPLNNPQPACNRRIGKPDGKGTDRIEQVTGRGLERQSENDDAGIARRIEAKRVAEVQVKSDQALAFGTTNLDQSVIGGRSQSFLYHRSDGIPCCPQNLRTPVAETLVELDLQADASRGTLT